MRSLIAVETLQRRFAGRSFEVDSLTNEAVILIDDEWQAVSIPVARFRCRLTKGATITVPFDETDTPNWEGAWEGAMVEEVSVEWLPTLETSTFEANISFA